MAGARRPSRGAVKDVGDWRVRSASSTARRGEISGPKCKWGRPEGRPHSHQRVDPEGYLAPSVVAFHSRSKPVPSGSVTGARTGIRFLQVVGPDPKILSCAAWRFRDRFPWLPPRTVASFRPKPSRRLLGERPGRPADGGFAGVPLKRSPCIRPKPFAKRSRRPRGQLPPSRLVGKNFELSGR